MKNVNISVSLTVPTSLARRIQREGLTIKRNGRHFVAEIDGISRHISSFTLGVERATRSRPRGYQTKAY